MRVKIRFLTYYHPYIMHFRHRFCVYIHVYLGMYIFYIPTQIYCTRFKQEDNRLTLRVFYNNYYYSCFLPIFPTHCRLTMRTVVSNSNIFIIYRLLLTIISHIYIHNNSTTYIFVGSRIQFFFVTSLKHWVKIILVHLQVYSKQCTVIIITL